MKINHNKNRFQWLYKRGYHFVPVLFIIFFLSSHQQVVAQFIDEARNLNILHSHITPNYIGGGVAILDINNDGFEDIYFTGGTINDRLYLNQTNGFEDISLTSYILTITRTRFTTSVTVGDVNNDGWDDIFLGTNNGDAPILLKNNQNNTFTDISETSGINLYNRWNSGASFADFNNDGLLDIYVTNYINLPHATMDSLKNIVGFEHECYPNELYINNGDGTFSEKSSEFGLSDLGCSLSSLLIDHNKDGWIDIILSNDFGEWVVPNQLYINQNGKYFEEKALLSGLQDSIYSMGIGVEDLNNDNQYDYYFSNIGNNSLRLSSDGGIYSNMAEESGLSCGEYESNLVAGWGVLFEDFNGDLTPDFYLINGYIPSASFIDNHKECPNQLFLYNSIENRFEEYFSTAVNNTAVGRGVARADLNNDGRIDLVTSNLDVVRYNNSSNVQVLINNFEFENNWIGIVLKGTETNINAIGTTVNIITETDTISKFVRSGGSYASQGSRRLIFNIAKEDKITKVFINWTSGKTQEIDISDSELNKYYQILESSDQLEELNCEQSNWGCSDIEEYEILDIRLNSLTFRNPIGGIYHLQDPVDIKIFSLSGKLLYTSKNASKIDFSNFNNGVYLIEYIENQQIYHQKIIVEN